MNISTAPLSRRIFLRGAGVTLALPLLDAMLPRSLRAAEDAAPRRMISICTNMGLMPRYFFPGGAGRDYALSPYLEIIGEHRADFTVFSGLSHPEVDGGHHAEVSFLTAAPHPGGAGFRNSISLDQFAAERVGIRTRFPFLSLDVGVEGRNGLSWTASGAAIPAESKPSAVYRRLFVQGTPAEVAEQVRRLREGRSILDSVADRARGLGRTLGANDRGKLDQYFTSVRELEQRLVKAEDWEQQPKPRVTASAPVDIDDPGALVERTRLMFSLARLALETDSTRIVTIKIDENNNPRPNIPGVTQGHHSLTHHGSQEVKIDELKLVETAQMKVFGELLTALKAAREEGRPLLDRTMVLHGSNLGNANSHDNRNLPILLAGGGFKHGQHLAFDAKSNAPLPDLFVTMLQRLGVETEKFATSTSTLRGLDAG